MKINGSPLSESTFLLSPRIHGPSYLREATLPEKPAARYLRRGVSPIRKSQAKILKAFTFNSGETPPPFPQGIFGHNLAPVQEGASPQTQHRDRPTEAGGAGRLRPSIPSLLTDALGTPVPATLWREEGTGTQLRPSTDLSP